jgi:hypothetical protein
MLVLELMALGNLRDVLRGCRAEDGKSQTVTVEELLQYCHHAALGMEHLAKHKIVHRDLAARNVL